MWSMQLSTTLTKAEVDVFMITIFCLIEPIDIPLHFLQDLFDSKISLLGDIALGVGGNNLQHNINKHNKTHITFATKLNARVLNFSDLATPYIGKIYILEVEKGTHIVSISQEPTYTCADFDSCEP
jgi:hypothetical protein